MSPPVGARLVVGRRWWMQGGSGASLPPKTAVPAPRFRMDDTTQNFHGAPASSSRRQAAPQTAPALSLPESVAHQLDVCVHCGFCLPVCPTYRELGSEADSPRGRIDIIRAAVQGEVGPADPNLRLHLDRCLDCRACESACPSGVHYGELYEAAVAGLAEQRRVGLVPGPVRLGLRHLVRHPRLLARFVRMALRWPAMVHWVFPAAADLLPGLPRVRQLLARDRLPTILPAVGTKRGEVEIFLGCVQDAVFGDDNLAMATALSFAGYEVHYSPRQTCCGALHVHIGDRASVLALARENINTFVGSDRPIAVNAAGCGAVLKDYGRLFGSEPFAEQARAIAHRTADFSELVAYLSSQPEVNAPVHKGQDRPLRVTYHDPCHLAHAQGVRSEPRAVLRSLPGIEFVELPEADSCCGSGGIYNLTQPELSARVLERKVRNIVATGAEVVATGNPGCALQLRVGLLRAGLRVQVVSVAELVARSYDGGVGERR